MGTGVSESATACPLPSVFIVEDDTAVRALLRAALDGIAWVLEASDGEQAVKVLHDRAGRAVDLMLVDHLLPKRSGLEVLRLSRQQWPWIPVVIITGFGSEDLAIQAFRAGAKDYLKKPIDVREFRRVILAHARRYRLLADRGAKPPETSAPFPEEAGATHLGICRALIFVREHFTEPITLGQVAVEAGLSRFHFCRLFHRQVGFSFRGYLHALRIDHAKILLADPRITVTDAAYSSGFNDLSHFDRSFNRFVGVSPTAYRRTI
jgi:YesN/AraC family two-component response regulator